MSRSSSSTKRINSIALLFLLILMVAISLFGWFPASCVVTNTSLENASSRMIMAPLAKTYVTSDKSIIPKDYFCVSWNIQMDDWWTHHIEWDVVHENKTHQCFQRMMNEPRTRHLIDAYNIMWNSPDCSETFVWAMFNSGWSADLTHVAEGIIYAVGDQKPFAIAFKKKLPWWHYAALKLNGTQPTCAARDMSCYFLPIGKCHGNESQIMKYKPKTKYSEVPDYFELEQIIVTKYITRQQQWLRQAVHDYTREKAPKLPIGNSCTVMHVRRGDVVLHVKNSRRYFAISDYMNGLPPERKAKGATILLLTDDQNAIDEAKEFFPDIDWRYYNRQRFRGTSGGWENTAPSNSPKQEVIIILSTLQLVQQCDGLVYGTSGFATAILRQMKATKKKIFAHQIDPKGIVRDPNFITSHLELEKRLEEMRSQKEKGQRVS